MDYASVGSRCGSTSNIKHSPGGGEKKVIAGGGRAQFARTFSRLDQANHNFLSQSHIALDR